MWRISDVNEGREYKLHLCQSGNGFRFFRLVEIGSDIDVNPPDDVILVTALIPNELLKRRALIPISETVLLDNGQPFFVDAHGVWLAEPEVREMDSGLSHNEIHWITGRAPEFAPK